MKPKSDKESEFPEKKPAANLGKTSSKKKDEDIDDDYDDVEEDEKPSKKAKGATSKKTSKPVDEDDDDDVEIEDDWEKPDDVEDYDPDFEEFDIPKSKIKKPSTKKGK